jgi:ribA/ribD-fused uncharacterized protein
MDVPQLGQYVDVKTTQFTEPQKVVYAGTPRQGKWLTQTVDYADGETRILQGNKMLTPITSFSGEHDFLSNFYPCDIDYEGLTFPSVEHAFQAAKTLNLLKRLDILNAPTPGKAKRMGRALELRAHWDDLKVEVMRDLLRVKFKNYDLAHKLVNTGTADLVEGNNWGDTFWGVCNGKGQNVLGLQLQRIRGECIVRLQRADQFLKYTGLDEQVDYTPSPSYEESYAKSDVRMTGMHFQDYLSHVK